MITHYIGTAFKPNQGYVSTYFAPNHENLSKIRNQQDLDEYWQNNPIKLVAFVKYEMRNGEQSIHHLDRVLMVLDVQRKFENLEIDYRGRPKLFKILGCSKFGTLAPRWESPEEFLPLTEEEYTRLVEPEHDHISDKIKRWVNEDNSSQ